MLSLVEYFPQSDDSIWEQIARKQLQKKIVLIVPLQFTVPAGLSRLSYATDQIDVTFFPAPPRYKRVRVCTEHS